MREAAQAPPDFVSYVDRRLGALERAAMRLTGDDTQAERLARELLTLVALRWRRLRRGDAKHRLSEGQSADLHLNRLYRHEAAEVGYPQVMLDLDGPAAVRRRTGRPVLRPVDEAELIWEAARRTMRRRIFLGATVAGVAALVALCQRRDDPPVESVPPEQTPVPRSTVLPPGAEVAPIQITAERSIRDIPKELTVPSFDTTPILSVDPVRRALLLAASARSDTSPAYVLGDDNRWRRVDAAPQLSAIWLQTSALSPDGTRAAFGTTSGVTIVDLKTGLGREYSYVLSNPRPAWIGPRQLVVAAGVMVDPVTGRVSPIQTGPDDVIVPRRVLDPSRDPAAKLTELLSLGEPATAGPRLRRWFHDPVRGPQQSIVALSGPLTTLIGPWRGPGFGWEDDNALVVRACAPNPGASLNGVNVIIAVIRQRTGQVERALLMDTTRMGNPRVMGWADERRVLLGLIQGPVQRIVVWDVVVGGLALVAKYNSTGVISLPDLSWVG